MVRRMKIPKETVMVIAFLMIVIVGYVLVKTETIVGLPAGTGANLYVVFPGLIVSVIGIVALGATKGVFALGSGGVAGIGSAILIEEMYSISWMNDVSMSGFTLGQVQGILIVMGIIAGATKWSLSR